MNGILKYITSLTLTSILISCNGQVQSGKSLRKDEKEIKPEANSQSHSCTEPPGKLVLQPLGMLGDSIHLGDSLKTLINAGVIGRLDPMSCDVYGLNNCESYQCFIWIPQSMESKEGTVTPLFTYVFWNNRLVKTRISLTYDGSMNAENAVTVLKSVYNDRYKSDSIVYGCYSSFGLDTSKTFYSLGHEIGYTGIKN